MTEKVTETAQRVDERESLLGQRSRTHAGDGLGHTQEECGFPVNCIADLVLKVSSEHEEEGLDGTVRTVNLIGHALDLYRASVVGVEAPCPVFDPCANLVDYSKLDFYISFQDQKSLCIHSTFSIRMDPASRRKVWVPNNGRIHLAERRLAGRIASAILKTVGPTARTDIIAFWGALSKYLLNVVS